MRLIKIKLLFLVFTICPLSICFSQKDTISFLALGDSYTVGTSESKENSWPVQLASKLSEKGIPAQPPKIIAGAGWTTTKLLEEIEAIEVEKDYDLVSLMIGVNNQYRGIDIEVFKKEFLLLLEKSIAFAKGKKQNVFVLSIPDWSITPFAALRNKEKIAREIERYNDIIKEETTKQNVLFIDVTPISKNASVNPSLIASDGLHPSKKMYRMWVKKIMKKLPKNIKS